MENLDKSCCYAYNHLQYKHWHINRFYSKTCQHHIICSIHIFIFIAAIIYFLHCICTLDVLILYSFVLISSWGWWFIAETCGRVHACEWFV